MTATATTPAVTTPPSEPSPERFFERVRGANPFLKTRVDRPTLEDEPDAATVHQKPFRELVRLARAARDQNLGVGAILWGEAGVGKSHLLSRLARWAHGEGQACFVYLQNLQPGPEHLPRTLLRTTVSILTQGRRCGFRDTPLYRLVESAVKTALRESPQTLNPARAYDGLLDRLAAQAPAQAAFVDRTTYNVLLRFLLAAADDDGAATLAVRWLSGDALDPDEARALGLPPLPARDEPVALADDQAIKLVLVALSQMALFAGRPLLLCFDQVENIDAEQIGALTRFLQAVLDGAPNLFVVTCGVRETLFRWREEKVIHEAAWDRVAQFEIALNRVSAVEARQIVETRLDHFLTPFMGLPEVKARAQGDRLFPLGEKWFDDRVKDKIDLKPRQVIGWAREGWTAEQQALEEKGGPHWLKEWDGGATPLPPPPPPPLETLIDRQVSAKLDEQRRQRRHDPDTLPPDADNMAGLALALLQQCLDGDPPYVLLDVRRPAPPKRGQRPAYQLTARLREGGRETAVAALFLTAGNATSAAAALRRVVEDRQPPGRLMLVTDERRPPHLAAKGKEYYNGLHDRYGERFLRIDLTFDQYIDLDALRAVEGMAGSGDVEIDLPGGEIRQVSEDEVVASHHRNNRYEGHPLLRPFLIPGEPPLQDPDAADLRQFIMAKLALTLGESSHELTLKYIDYRKATKRTVHEAAVCKPLLEKEAEAMAREGLINVSPCDGGLFLMPRMRPKS